MATIVEKIDKVLTRFEKNLMFVTGLALFVLMVWCVIARYSLSVPTPYQGELTKTLHIWLCFIGGSYAISVNGQPSVEIFLDKVLLSKNIVFRKVYSILIYMLSLFFLVPCLFYAIKQSPLYARQVTTYLGYSYLWVYGGGIIGLAMMCFRYLLKIVEICSSDPYIAPPTLKEAIPELADAVNVVGEQK